MALYTKDSIESLRQRIQLIDVIEPYVELKKAGAQYKGLCPFHDEKSPSFTLQKGDSHYHCFGCGAHGDAIEFIMSYLKLNFVDAIQMLAEKFQVHLDRIEGSTEYKGPKKSVLKEAVEQACLLYEFTLLHTDLGTPALNYLHSRGIDLEFIETFRIGFAPKIPGYLRKVLHAKGFSDEVLLAAGLLSTGQDGRIRDFFSDRITFAIHEPSGAVIGFSARKFKEETFGGKYVNTSETPLFKKSKILFGLNYCRREIAKRREAIIVEGQVDALRLIHAGFDYTVAGQGTAFGEGHVQELLLLGVQKVTLVLDSDRAGREAAIKIGDLFQKKGVEVYVADLLHGKDPDEFIRLKGKEAFKEALDQSKDYLTFAISHYSQSVNITSPAGKSQLVDNLKAQIAAWESDLMKHESLKKMAHLLNIPEQMAGVGAYQSPNVWIQQSAKIGLQTINPVRILEADLIRWLMHPQWQKEFLSFAKDHLTPDDFLDLSCREAFSYFLQSEKIDLLKMAEEPHLQELLQEISQKLVNAEKGKECFVETVKKILDRNWLEKLEAIRRKIISGSHLSLKEFDELKKNPPKVANYAKV